MSNKPTTNGARSVHRTTIGNNPLDAVVPDLKNLTRTANNHVQTSTHVMSESGASTTVTQRSPLRKERLTVHLPTELIERAKNAVFWTPGLTLADLGQQAFEELLDKLEDKHGKPFEKRLSELKGGRPLR